MKSVEERIAAILAAVEELCRRRAITDKFDPMDAPGQWKPKDKAALTGRAAALAHIAIDHKRIEAINAKLTSR
ncbi:hypothetical protein ASE98_23360 [Pseudomonas sp. Leaf48]|uniref:hypothetical protein n=1 Tax=Pseudomonas sp. Leaf48 TaxID=1736221 RepID=UPI00072B671A|nr:hypothetical protein [Pseudomonas sp. Leaf48]KQN50463.1 hypothetical protein ASE98_23360 [Pseudomonas sp. Leaf48]